MPDRTINFGDDAADARYRIQDTSSTGGDLVLAEDLDGGTVLLEYDYSASEWVSRGPVNLSGNDITNAGSITADSLEASEGQINGETLVEADRQNNSNSIASGTFTNIVDNENKDRNSEFNNSYRFVPDKTGYYDIIGLFVLKNNASGDRYTVRIQNITTSSTRKIITRTSTASPNNIFPNYQTVAELSSGDEYEIQVSNLDSSFVVGAASTFNIYWRASQ